MATPSHGIEQLGFVVVESGYDVNGVFASGNAFGFNTMKIKPTLDFNAYREHVGSGSLQGENEAKRGGDFEVEAYVKPNGAATEPQVGPFIKAGSMLYAAGIYTLSLSSSALVSLQVGRRAGDSLYEVINGLCISKQEFEAVGANAFIGKFSGRFASYGALLGVPITNGSTISNGASTFTLATQTPSQAFKIRPGVTIAIGGNVGAGAGYLVTGLSADGLTPTFSPVISGGPISGGATVTPYTPTATIAGSVVGGIADDLSIGGTSLGCTSFKLVHETGLHLLDKEFGTNRANRIARGERSVSAEAIFYFLDENAGYMGAAWNGTTRAIICRAGPNTAGSRFKISTPAARIKVAEAEIPDAEETMWKAEMIARKSAANEDELAFDTN